MWSVGIILLAILTKTEAAVELEESLQKRLAERGSATIFATFSKSPLSICTSANKSETPVELIRKLKAHASLTQKPILDILNRNGVPNYHSYWISNRIYIPDCAANIISVLQLNEDISDIKEERHFPLEPIRRSPGPSLKTDSWGISAVKAPEVWRRGVTGQGVIVGHIDTGVRWTHADLRSSYSGLWHDPGKGTPEPNDQNGHGTHTMGTIVGANGIGVAPGAKWLSCKGCGSESCSEADLLACGQWISCPDGEVNGCQKKPHVCSNSWGGDGFDSFYESTVACWLAMDIIPVFANGNSGPHCGSTVSPGSSPDVISVGAVDSTRQLASFSARGLSATPAPLGPIGRFKPDLAAPGVEIRSAWHTSDDAYDTISGTSMATPHVAGVIALLLSSCSKMRDFHDTRTLLAEGCSRDDLKRPAVICEEVNLASESTPLEFPNNEYGSGSVDALRSIEKLTCHGWMKLDYRRGKTYVPATSAHRNGLAGSQGKNVWYPKSWAEVMTDGYSKGLPT